MPNERERASYNAIKLILARMIKDSHQLIQVPKDMWRELQHLRPPLESASRCIDMEMPLRNGVFDFREEHHRQFGKMERLLRDECSTGLLGWSLEHTFPDGARLLSREEHDDRFPLKSYCVQVCIPFAPLNQIITVILQQR